MMESWQWALGGLCALLVGISKTGLPGMGILVVPLMVPVAQGWAPGAGQGLLLPLLCTADLFAVWWYRRHRAVGRLWGLLPWVAVGLAGGWAALRWMPEPWMKPLVGTIVLAMVGLHLLRRRLKEDQVGHGLLAHAGFGAMAGFATTVANAAGPVMGLYLLSQRLPKEEFIATGAWFFFAVNLAKLPVYAQRGLISRETLLVDALLVVAVLAGALVGRRLQARIPQRGFEGAVLALAAVAGGLLLL